MAEAALASIAKSALQLFTSLAKDEFLLLWNSQKELKRLETSIELITNIHQDTKERGSNDGSVQHCMSKLRNVMYDAEDFFDALAAQILHKRTMVRNAFTKEVQLFFSDANQIGVVFKIAHEVKAIRESLDDIKKDMELYGLIRQQPPLVKPFIRPKTHSFVPDEDVVGRDQDRDRIINMLLPQDSQSLSVIAIIGFGGLGKTTLAQYVYNDERVKQSFDVHLWACINYLSDLEQVLIEIIASKEKRHSDFGLQKLQEKLRELISGEKFLLVLDDVWDENSGNWMKLEPFLRCGKTGSKVLVTTRSRKVVECLGASKPNCCLDLAVLSEESAWSLFVQKAFYSKEELSGHPELEPLGKKIVQRCGNVPLAVIIVGSLLRHREKGERIWSNFLDKELNDSLSKCDDKNSESIRNVLMLSYNDLLPELKLCFAYCSLFPKDYTFDKDVLVRLWIAQGFLKSSADDEKSFEKDGEEYFFYLVERCFFQEVKQKWKEHTRFFEDDENYRYGHTAKMHDLIHDVAMDVAKTDSAFLDKVSTISKGEKDNLRHISISCDLDSSFDYCSLVSYPKTVRTLLIHRGKQFSKDPLNMSLERFRMIRTLHLSQLGIDNLSECIGELIHLRYLDLSHNLNLKHLPKSICKLHHLMILVLVNCILLEDLPPNIEKLVSLRQLCIHGCKSLGSLPAGLIALTSLVKLDRLVVHRQEGGLRYLQGLDNLCGILKIELPVDGWSDAIIDAEKANMSMKPKLNGMFIEWKGEYHRQEMPRDEARAILDALEPHRNLEYLKIDNYGGEMLSSWFNTLKNVTELRLSRCDVEYLEDEIRGDSYFPSLKILILLSLQNLKGWWRQEVVEEAKWPRLPKVSEVRIWSCPELKGRMPVFEEFEDLVLEWVDMELVTELLIRKHNKVKTLRLHGIDGLMSLPEGWLRHLTHLQKLNVEYCNNLEWVSCRGLAHLTALKDLNLECCKIIDVGDDGEVEIAEGGMPWKALKGLESLKVAASDEYLIDGLQYLTSLRSLDIIDWKDEQVGDEGMESSVEVSLKALRNLRKLGIGFDSRTAGLPKVIQYLSSLETLRIDKCEELYLGWKTLLSMKLNLLMFSNVKRVINVEDMVMEKQSQLRSLIICNGEAEWIDDVPWNSLASLKFLRVSEVKGMKQLPNGIQHLTSLQGLFLDRCEEVRSLPNWIPKLASLTTLEISNCSTELTRRCEKEMGEDWSLIRHLPYVLIEARVVYRWDEDVIGESMDEDVIGELRDEEEGEGSLKRRWCGLPLSFH